MRVAMSYLKRKQVLYFYMSNFDRIYIEPQDTVLNIYDPLSSINSTKETYINKVSSF